MKILVTGSKGLVGRALVPALKGLGHDVEDFDIVSGQDIRDPAALQGACGQVDGIVHLAAVSRVVWAQRDPGLCEAVNKGGLTNLADAMRGSGRRPWLVFASSREVYGQQAVFPVHEDADLQPCNVYARSKCWGEELVTSMRDEGFPTGVVRLSNVYGDIADHADRVVPAFARAAAFGGELRIEGADNLLDFTNVADVSRGVVELVNLVSAGERTPPVHLTTGRGVSLGDLAEIAQRNARQPLEFTPAPPRDYDVSHFFGDPRRARELLGWRAEVAIEDGFARLAKAFSDAP